MRPIRLLPCGCGHALRIVALLLLSRELVGPGLDRLEATHRALLVHAPKICDSLRVEMVHAIGEAERDFAVGQDLILAVIEKESRFVPHARGPGGTIGLMQLKPGSARVVARDLGLVGFDPKRLKEPRTNILLGAAYLAKLKESFGSWELALTAYNRGPGVVDRALRRGARPSGSYATTVLARRQAFSELPEP